MSLTLYLLLGGTLMRRYKAAIRERNIQVEGHRGFSSTLPKLLTIKWEAMCRAWDVAEHPKKVSNPYKSEGIRAFFQHLQWRRL